MYLFEIYCASAENLIIDTDVNRIASLGIETQSGERDEITDDGTFAARGAE